MQILRAIVLFLVVGMMSSVASAASPPVTVIENLHAKLIETMKQADQLGIDGRYQAMRPTVYSSRCDDTVATAWLPAE